MLSVNEQEQLGGSNSQTTKQKQKEEKINEHPSHSLLVKNVQLLTNETLAKIFQQYGDVKTIDMEAKQHNFVIVTFFDIRAAKLAQKNVNGANVLGKILEVHFFFPKTQENVNQGTLVVFNLNVAITRQELHKMFGKFGEIKEIRETPNKKHHKFIEFFDTRSAETAMNELNKTLLSGKKIKIELSRPGGARRGQADSLENIIERNSSISSNSTWELEAPPFVPRSSKTSSSPLGNTPISPSSLNQQNFPTSPALPQPPSGKFAQVTLSNSLLSKVNNASTPNFHSPPAFTNDHGHLQSGVYSSNSRAKSESAFNVNLRKQQDSFEFLEWQNDLNSISSFQQNNERRDSLSSSSSSSTQNSSESLTSISSGISDQFIPSLVSNVSFQQQQQENFAAPLFTSDFRLPVSSVSNVSLINPFVVSSTSKHSPSHSPSSLQHFNPETENRIKLDKYNYYDANPDGTDLEKFSSSSTLIPVNPIFSFQPNLLTSPVLRSGQQQSKTVFTSQQNPISLMDSAQSALFEQEPQPSKGFFAEQNMWNSPPLTHQFHRETTINSNPITVNTTTIVTASKEPKYKNIENRFTIDTNSLFLNTKSGKRIDKRTTLMIRNIPNKYTQKMLLALVDSNYHCSYNFFYLPIDFKNRCNVGYAFINMVSVEHIIPIYYQLHKKKWEKFNSDKVCEITYARIQGLGQLVAHFKNSSLLAEDEKVRPVILINGRHEPFPVNVTLRIHQTDSGGEYVSCTQNDLPQSQTHF